MSTYLITGTSRSLGLELAKQLSQRDDVSKVLATSRRAPTDELSKLIASSNGKIVHALLDVTSQESVDAAVPEITKALDGKGLDVLINNVGIQIYCDRIGNMPTEQFLTVLNANVLSAHRVTAALLPLLGQGTAKKVVNISTTVGAIGLAHEFRLVPQPAYKITKAALNMLTVQYALDYEKDGFTFVALSPGWLQTDMAAKGGVTADLETPVGAAASIDQILSAGPEKNGQFLNVHVPGWEDKEAIHRYDGKRPPW